MITHLIRPIKNMIRLFRKGRRHLSERGVRSTVRAVVLKLRQHFNFKRARKPVYSPEQLLMQREEVFPRKIVISILVPLYNTPERFLREMIESVLAQTYPGWELCLADGSDDGHAYVGTVCSGYAENDPRIKYRKLEKNLGISGNTNACIRLAAGEYIALFDHDDLLHPAALHDVMEAICEQGADFIYTDENTFHEEPGDAYCPHFKPDYAPDTLRGNNYICHLSAFSAGLLAEVGDFRSECDGSQDHDMILRLTEKAKKIVHIPRILYYWRAHAGSVAEQVGAKPYVIEAAHKALRDHLERVGLKGAIEDTFVPSIYRIRYEICGEPLVSVLVRSGERADKLRRCIESVYGKTSYRNFEVVLIRNKDCPDEISACCRQLQERHDTLRVVVREGESCASADDNFAAAHAKGDYLLLLSHDTEVISPAWVEELLMFAQRKDVGAAGAKLLAPDGTIRDAGLGLGLMSAVGHLHRGFDGKHQGYMGRLAYAQDLSGVTADCMMIRRDVWEETGGFDETFRDLLRDADLCLRLRKAGYLIVWTPFAELCESGSEHGGGDSAREKAQAADAAADFRTRWAEALAAGDPFLNPNFSRDSEAFFIC